MNPKIEVLTLSEAAQFLRVSERTLWSRAKANDVPHAKVGSQYRFTRGQLTKWLESQSTTSK